MKRDELQQAYDTIKEWGINCDDFVACNFRYTMYGGSPSDNSCEVADFFNTQLKTIVKLGLMCAEEALKPNTPRPTEG